MTDFTPEGKRGPGRPRKDEQDKPDTRASQDKRQRRRRDDMGDGRLLRLHIPMQARDPNCEHRWINDTVGGRLVNKTQFDDWDIVTKGELDEWTQRHRGEPYDARKDTDSGDAVSRVVGTNEHGQPLRAFWCKKPKEWFEEDYKKAQAAIDDQEKAMERAPIPSEEGLTGKHAYSPSGNTIGRDN